MDYAGNSKKEKEQAEVPDKKIEKIITGEVIIQKKSMARKFKDLIIEADIRSVLRYIGSDVLIPAAKNMISDAAAKGVDRMMYGEAASRRRGIGYGGGSRISYNNPVNRGFSGAPSRFAPAVRNEPRGRQTREDFILSSREEADSVLSLMNEIIDQYQAVSVADLNEMVGLPTAHTDQKWGWDDLRGVRVEQVREGYLIDFPPTQHLD